MLNNLISMDFNSGHLLSHHYPFWTLNCINFEYLLNTLLFCSPLHPPGDNLSQLIYYTIDFAIFEAIFWENFLNNCFA